jgi:hypothetical protein
LQTELQLDVSMLNGGNPHRIFNLELFAGITQKTVLGSQATVIEQGFQHGYYDIKDGDVLRGYWQCEDYFRDITPQVFRALRLKFPIPQLFIPYAMQQIENAGDTSTFVGIRRGDYLLKQDYHGVLPVDYYNRGLRYIHNVTGKTPTVFVFTDDMDWCKKELVLDYPFEILGSTNPTVSAIMGREDVDILLMSMCRHAVIANSSFHWWGAWAGDFKQQPRCVVAPKQWFTTTSVDDSTVTPERWTRL